MVNLKALINRIEPKKILLLGDVILDKYIYGAAKRISPEAPVPVVLVKRFEERVGGAANVAKNLRTLGMHVTLASIVGQDEPANIVHKQLEEIGCFPNFVRDSSFVTPEKVRVIAQHQQVVRIDYEKPNSVSEEAEEQFIFKLEKLINEHDVVAVSDYAKGSLTPKILQKAIQYAKRRNIPLIVDPKGADFTKYNGAFLVKPNLSEAYAAAGLSFDSSLAEVAQRIFSKTSIDVLMITRSEEGISLFFPDGSYKDHPAHACEVSDVTGAGDTVLAVVTASLANKLSLSEAAICSNVAAACAVEHIGCAAVSFQDMLQR